MIIIKRLLFLFLFIIEFVVFINGQMTFAGKCNNVTTQSNFNITKYLGRWYEIQKYPTIFQSVGRCISFNLYQHGNVTYAQNTMLLQNKNMTIERIVQEVHPDIHDGKLKVLMPDYHNSTQEFWILETDYDHYSVVWSCIQQNNHTNKQFAWILSRTINETKEQRSQVEKVLENNKLDLEHFMRVNQTHCDEKRQHHSKNGAYTVTTNTLYVIGVAFIFILKQLF